MTYRMIILGGVACAIAFALIGAAASIFWVFGHTRCAPQRAGVQWHEPGDHPIRAVPVHLVESPDAGALR